MEHFINERSEQIAGCIQLTIRSATRRFLTPHDAAEFLRGEARICALQHRSALLHEHVRARGPTPAAAPPLCDHLDLSYASILSERENSQQLSQLLVSVFYLCLIG